MITTNQKLTQPQVTWSVHPGKEENEERPHCSLQVPCERVGADTDLFSKVTSDRTWPEAV